MKFVHQCQSEDWLVSFKLNTRSAGDKGNSHFEGTFTKLNPTIQVWPASHLTSTRIDVTYQTRETVSHRIA